MNATIHKICGSLVYSVELSVSYHYLKASQVKRTVYNYGIVRIFLRICSDILKTLDL
ncbi:hypothetical protein PY092_19235 [Muricauda sp. 334s03]|uniref:Uncharacterized protein n=1 Tax=Flagellimonas yonaguniensis TaxID=3031325 RepID=A0ABT5Y5M6_9FLAO|nr:hypothetical protein [[Muricauda] yonaguniensis]MDF0718302.1 hypothetical protein [[Muricauda] yonaguniensis]